MFCVDNPLGIFLIWFFAVFGALHMALWLVGYRTRW